MKIVKNKKKGVAIKCVNRKHGEKIIKYLESLGGYNFLAFTGMDNNAIYYIDLKDNKIRAFLSSKITDDFLEKYNLINSNEIN